MTGHARLRMVRSGPIAKKIEVPISRELLDEMGRVFVKVFAREAKKDFAKRGWSGEAEDGSAPIWDSFSYVIRDDRTIEVLSTYPGLDALTSTGIPRHKMTWLTQEQKNTYPSRYPTTRGEAERGMRRGGRISKDERLPLVVPFKDDTGKVVFRTAPLRTQDAWVHPGIARFTFAERAARLGKQECMDIIKGEIARLLIEGRTT